MNLEELLGIDLSKPQDRLARDLVRADYDMLNELVRLRKSRNLTQTEVAQRMGISQSAVARIEGGERDPHLSTLRRYALAVEAHVDHRVVDARVLDDARRAERSREAARVGSVFSDELMASVARTAYDRAVTRAAGLA